MSILSHRWFLLSIPVLALACIAGGCGEGSDAKVSTESAPASAEAQEPPKASDDGGGLAATGTPKGRIQTTTAAGPLEIVPESFEFGAVAPGSINMGSFLIRNGGDRPVKVLQVKPSCVCTTLSDLAGTSIPAGGMVALEASLDAPKEPGEKDAKVFVQLEGMSRPAIVKLVGMVTMPVQPEPTYASALKGVDRGIIRLASNDGRPFQISASNGAKPDFVGFDPARDAPRNVYEVRWSIAGIPPMSIPRWWVFTTDRPDCPLVPCRVRNENTGSKRDMARFERRWIPTEDLVNLGRVPVGAKLERVFEIDHYNPRGGGSIDRPRWREDPRVESTDSRIRATLISSAAAGPEKTVLVVRLEVVGPPTPLLYGGLDISTATGSGVVDLVAEIVP